MTEAQRLAEAPTCPACTSTDVWASLRNAGEFRCGHCDNEWYVDAAIDQLASMIPAGGLAEEARDAARYRHLTDVHGPRSELCFDGDVCAGKAEFDAMIDASIAALSAPTPQQEQPR